MKIKKILVLISIISCLCLTMSVSFALTNDSKSLIVNDGQGHNVDLSTLKPLMNYQQTDFAALKRAMSILNPLANRNSINTLTTSIYGHAWAYVQQNSSSINCYCYSLRAPFRMNPGDGDGVPDCTSQAALDNYFTNVNIPAAAVVADGETNPLYFKGSSTGAEYTSWRILSSRTATITAEEHRIALRVGWVDANNNGHVDTALNEADYHFMLQTSTGEWCEKHGQQPSINDGYINPSTFSWDLGTYKNFYNSPTVYLAVRVW